MATVDTNLNPKCKSEDQVIKFIKCKNEFKLHITPFNIKARKCRVQTRFSGAVSSELLETAEALLGRGRLTHQ